MKGTLSYILCLFIFVCVLPEGKSQMIFDTLQLSELEILGSKTDYFKTVKQTSLDTIVKQDLNYSNLGEILGVYTPVVIKSYGRGALATASFRGTSASHTQVYWNDFIINSPMLGQVDFSLIPNSFVDEVELFYGGGSLLKAGGALGGGVSLNSHSGFAETEMLTFEQVVGSFGFISSTAGLNLGNDKFNSSTRFSYQGASNNFEYANSAVSPAKEVKQTNADYKNTGFTQQFSYKPNQHQLLTFSTWNQWNKRNIPPLMTNLENGIEQIEYQEDVFSRSLLSWAYHKNRSKLEVKAAYFYTDMHYFLGSVNENNESGADTTVDSKNKTNSIFGKVKFDQSFRYGISLTAGLDYDHERVNTNNYNELKTRNTYSLYAMVVKDFKSRLKLSLILRGVLVDGEVLPPMPLVGINYKLLKHHRFYLRATFSGNYHLPTLNDLYWNPGGNPDLIPEDSKETEGGLNYVVTFKKGLTLDADLNVFASWINNWIQWTPSEYGYWSPANISEVFARGTELSLKLNGKAGKLAYKILGQYAYTRTTNESQYAKDEGYSGKQLIYIPVHTASGFVHVDYVGYYLNWTLSYTGEQSTSLNTDFQSGSTLPAYMLNNFSVGKNFYLGRTKLDARFAVLNLFDVDYQAVLWRAMPGRNYEISLKLKINNKK